MCRLTYANAVLLQMIPLPLVALDRLCYFIKALPVLPPVSQLRVEEGIKCLAGVQRSSLHMKSTNKGANSYIFATYNYGLFLYVHDHGKQLRSYGDGQSI